MTRFETFCYYGELARIIVAPVALLGVVLGGFWLLIGAPLALASQIGG